MDLEFSKDQIFIIPLEDKPVKLIFENDISSIKTEKYHLTLREVLFNILRCNFELRKNLTRQQIHSERGKVKRGCYDQVVNFLVKRDISKEYIDNEISQEREQMIIKRPLKINVNDIVGQFGLINLE